MKQIFKNKRSEILNLCVISVSVVCLSVFIQSCSSDEFEDISPNGNTNVAVINIEANDWKGQLENIMNLPPDMLQKSGIKLLSYEMIEDVDNSKDGNHYKTILKEDENMFPLYSNDFRTIKAIAKKEASLRSSQHQAFTFTERDEFLDNLDLDGAKILSLKWDNDGVETNTLCVVSDKDGIVYDNFITNVFVVKDPVIVTAQVVNEVDNAIPRLKSSSEYPSDRVMTWTLTAGADWIWGSERGSVIINHEGYYSGRSFIYHDFSASHYFNLGTSDAQVKALGSNAIAYGYGFSTGTITINLTFSYPGYQLTFSGALGSKSGGVGQHSHPWTI